MAIPSVTVAVESVALRREFTTKSGPVVGVQNFTASIPVGSVFGLLGENGAGKTTLVRMFAGLLRPTSGSLVVLGHDAVADGSHIRRRVSLMLGGERGFFDRLSGWDNLRYFGSLSGLKSSALTNRASELVEVIGLSNFVKRPVEQYSRGMRQKLHFARALLASPELLLLDEPTAGLDPESAYEMRKTIQGLQSSGTSFVVTSHSLMEVQSLCQHVSVLRRGVQVALGTPDRLLGGLSIGAKVDEYLIDVADLQRFRDAVDLGGVARVVERWDGESWRCSVVHDASWNANLSTYKLQEERMPSTEEAYLLALLLPELTWGKS